MLYITQLEKTLKRDIVSLGNCGMVLAECIHHQSVDRLNVGIKYSSLNCVLLVG